MPMLGTPLLSASSTAMSTSACITALTKECALSSRLPLPSTMALNISAIWITFPERAMGMGTESLPLSRRRSSFMAGSPSYVR